MQLMLLVDKIRKYWIRDALYFQYTGLQVFIFIFSKQIYSILEINSCTLFRISLHETLHENSSYISWPSDLYVRRVEILRHSPPGWLILLLAHWFRPLTKRRASAEAVAMATQAVALSGNVGSILDDQLVVGSQPHVLCPLQETLHAALLCQLQWQPAMNTPPGQPATHHWEREGREGEGDIETSEVSLGERWMNPDTQTHPFAHTSSMGNGCFFCSGPLKRRGKK